MIERPVSVVKELVENALDASPSKISVQVFQGGKSRITVQDDGEGIYPEDLHLSLERHATSKIHDENDLDNINTMGYRGEALSSISAVSRMEIRSRRVDLREGSCLFSEPEVAPHISKINCLPGTLVRVEDLFFNMPARRKFLSSALGEFRRISQLIRYFALAQPEIIFTLSHDGKTVFKSTAAKERDKLIQQAWGSKDGILSKRLSVNDMSIEVWFQDIPGKRLNFQAFVNRRIVDDKLLRSAVLSVKGKLSGNLFIFLKVSPNEVDVNIHPTKTEIRYRNNREVFELARNSMVDLLMNMTTLHVPGQFPSLPDKPDLPEKATELTPIKSDGPVAKGIFQETFPSIHTTPNLFSRVGAPPVITSGRVDTTDFSRIVSENLLDDLARWRFVEQTSSGYLLFDVGGDLVLIDPHAAHERINFEALRLHSRMGTEKQFLNPPLILDPDQAELVAQYLPQLENSGFLFISDQKSGKTQMSALPSSLSGFPVNPTVLLESLLHEWEEGISTTIDNRILAKWASLACKASLKITSRISEKEVAFLLEQLSKCDNPCFCPHGRPTMLRFSIAQIEKFFRRKE